METEGPEDDEELQIVGEYQLQKTIGKGNFSTVRLAYHRIAQRRVAIKVVEKEGLGEDSLHKIHREIQILRSLAHPNIIRLYEVLQTEKLLFIVTEYVGGSEELFRLLTERGSMEEGHARAIFGQIVAAIGFCHARRVCHRDLKVQFTFK